MANIYDERIKLLKQMNDYVCNTIGDEVAWEDWIAVGVPDCATEEDYEFIAHDESEWQRICTLFGKIVTAYEEDG